MRGQTLTLYRPKTHIHVINQFYAKWPMTRIRVMDTFGVFFECSGLLATIYAMNHIYCTHRKLNVQYWFANRQRMSQKLDIMGRKALSQSTGPSSSRPISRSTQALWRWNKKPRKANWLRGYGCHGYTLSIEVIIVLSSLSASRR